MNSKSFLALSCPKWLSFKFTTAPDVTVKTFTTWGKLQPRIYQWAQLTAGKNDPNSLWDSQKREWPFTVSHGCKSTAFSSPCVPQIEEYLCVVKQSEPARKGTDNGGPAWGKTAPFLSVDEQSTARTRNFSAWVLSNSWSQENVCLRPKPPPILCVRRIPKTKSWWEWTNQGRVREGEKWADVGGVGRWAKDWQSCHPTPKGINCLNHQLKH